MSKKVGRPRNKVGRPRLNSENHLYKLRMQSGLSISDVEEMLNITNYYRYENGWRKPKIDTAKKLADLFKCSLEKIYDIKVG
ncbi:MAG: helix-turn-helix transcriptional regulator [Bacteroidota bacterium]|nr:helix-turn-helix transcriptional regulator [Bacteroidota bacterium]